MKKFLIALITLLVLVRIYFLYSSFNFESMVFTKDSFHYIEISKDFFSKYINGKNDNFWVYTFRLPGYPFILLLINSISEVRYVIYINLIFDLISSIYIFKFLYKFSKSTFTSYFGVVLFLLNSNILISSTQIMTESVSTALLLVSVFYIDQNSISKNLISGISLGLFSLIKPLGIYILFLFIFYKIFYFRKKIKEIIIFSFIPLCLISLIYANNYQNYNTFFYSTSSYFHTQWFNDASDALCEELNFNQLRVSEPGYKFELWKESNNFDSFTNPEIFINTLKNDSNKNVFRNIDCKIISASRSIAWNMFGIRQNNWNNSFLNQSSINIVKIYSLFYVTCINFVVLFTIFKSIKSKHSYLIYLIIFYLAMTSIIPFGNARIRVLIEPYLVILFVLNLGNFVKPFQDWIKKSK